MQVILSDWDENSEPHVHVEIDPWDTYNLDVNLCHILVPAIKLMKEQMIATPLVHDYDLPTHLQDSDDWQERWEYVLDEILFACESHLEDILCEMLLEDWDRSAIRSVDDRISNGFNLLGKYFRCLWQ